MGNSQKLDRGTYESSKIYLEAALKQMAEAGHRIHDLSEFALEKFGDEFLPYLERFYRDIREGNIRLKQSVTTAVFGQVVGAGERERMIRDAAYLRAEQRGFGAGSPDDDWLQAERQVDQQLARHIGLVAKGRKGVSSVKETAEKELAGAREAVASWLEKRGKSSPSPAPEPGKVKAAKKDAPAKGAAGEKKRAVAGGSKSAGKKAPKKRPATKA
jgi:hypothetical protein